MFNNYILTNILQHINSGKDYKSCCLVSKQFYNTINQLFPGGDIFANHLLTLLKLFPNENWNYTMMSGNHNITIEYILQNLDKNWNYEYLIKNSRFTLTDILNNPQIPWSYEYISYNLNIPANNEEWEFILQHHEYNWNYYLLSTHKGITWDIIINNLDKFGKYVSANYNVTLDIIRNNPDLEWNYYELSMNYGVTFDIVNELIDKNWDFDWLLQNMNIFNDSRTQELYFNNRHRMSAARLSDIAAIDTIINNPNINWNYNRIIQRKDITFEFLKNHPNIPWESYLFSKNPNVNINIVLQNPEFDWKYRMLSFNFSIKISDIIKNIGLFIDTSLLSYRKDLTWRIVQQHPELFNFNNLSGNNFNYYEK